MKTSGNAPPCPVLDSRIDAIKTIGIILVVAGHTMGGTLGGFTGKFIYLFHMPLFFFLSGYLFKSQPAKEYLFKKAKYLLIPYFAYLTLFNMDAIFKFLQYAIQTPSFELFQAFGDHVSQELYGGEKLAGYTGIFWFVTCLFFTQQIYNFLQKRFPKSLNTIIAASYGLAVVNQLYIQSPLPMALNIVLEAIVFFHLGHCFKNWKSEPPKLLTLSVLLSVLGIALLMAKAPINFDMKHADYGIPVISPILALAVIYIIFRLSKTLTKFPRLIPLFSFTGGASMTIMFLHQFVHFRILNKAGIQLPVAQFILSFTLALLAYWSIQKIRPLRPILLGEQNLKRQ